jgi:hypothetical protein
MHGPSHIIRTSAFPFERGEDADTNPGVPGRSVANYVAAQMRARGRNVEGIIPEDFGYCVILARKPLMLWIACSNRSESTDEWMAFAVAERELIKRAMGKVDPAAEIGRVSDVLGEIMKSAPGVETYSVESRIG